MKTLRKASLSILFTTVLAMIIIMSLAVPVTADTTDLSDEKIAGILFIREEE